MRERKVQYIVERETEDGWENYWNDGGEPVVFDKLLEAVEDLDEFMERNNEHRVPLNPNKYRICQVTTEAIPTEVVAMMREEERKAKKKISSAKYRAANLEKINSDARDKYMDKKRQLFLNSTDLLNPENRYE
jgi:hypothetical protein